MLDGFLYIYGFYDLADARGPASVPDSPPFQLEELADVDAAVLGMSNHVSFRLVTNLTDLVVLVTQR